MVASHRGDSHSSVATRRRVAKLFDEWRETLSVSDARNLAPAAFESIVNADAFSKPETYQRFATWLVDEYTMNDYGERLRLTEDLNELVLTRLACMYKGYGAKLPKVLEQPKRGMKRKVPPVSFFENQKTLFVNHCKKEKIYVRGSAGDMFTGPDRVSIQAWRAEYERGGVAPAVVPEQPPAAASRGGMMGALFGGG